MTPPAHPWAWLILAGLCEIVYALAMPHTQSFTRLWPSVLALLFVGLSMYGRSVAARVPAAGALHRGAVRNRLDNQSRAI